MQYSNTLDIMGLIAMPRKSSHFKDLLKHSFGFIYICSILSMSTIQRQSSDRDQTLYMYMCDVFSTSQSLEALD